MHAAAHPEVFRPAGTDTFPAETVRSLAADSRNGLFVAEAGGSIEGYLVAVTQEHPANPWKHAVTVLSIEQMGVRPSRQGQGIGRALLAAAEQFARERGLAEIRLSVWTFNEAARRFYERAGYQAYQEQRRRMID